MIKHYVSSRVDATGLTSIARRLRYDFGFAPAIDLGQHASEKINWIKVPSEA
jgi:hypothetical protein